MKKNLIVKQDGYKECGVACLLSIIRYYHGNVSINRLIEWTYTDKSGTNFYYLKETAERVGLEAIGYKIDNNNLFYQINKPFICQIVDHHYEHFVVVYQVKKNKVIMMDPAYGEKIVAIGNWLCYDIFTKEKITFFKRTKISKSVNHKNTSN